MTAVFVGYDVREHPAWLVCRDTLLRPFDTWKEGDDLPNLNVVPLSHKQLRRDGLLTRPWTIDETGQPHDIRDTRPFSTDFSHSRFLVPALARKMGIKSGPVVFVDCDFMFLQPIQHMLERIDPTKVVSVVKHDTHRLSEGTKMDGVQQSKYPRKLWSSLMVFNMGHPDIDRFNADAANTNTGSELHGLLGLKDHEIGEINPSWNHIPGMSIGLHIDAIHWSFGGPWMAGYEKAKYASQWRCRYKEVTRRALEHDNPADLYPMS